MVLRKQFINNFVFPTWACTAGFHNNNNNNNNNSTLVQPSIEWVTVVSYSNWNLLVLVAVCCPFVESSSLTIGRESWLMVLRVRGSQSFQPLGSVWGPVLIILYTTKMFELVRTDYMPMQMTPHFWQLSTSQQTDLLLLPQLPLLLLS